MCCYVHYYVQRASRFTFKIRNALRNVITQTIYTITKAETWSRVIKTRRLNWLGHLMRLRPETPVQLLVGGPMQRIETLVGNAC